MPGCLETNGCLDACNKKRRPRCLPKKRMPGCLTKNGCMQKHHKPYLHRTYTVLTRTYAYLRYRSRKHRQGWCALGSCNGQRVCLGHLAKFQKSKECVRLGHLAVAMGKGVGRVACPHQECTNTLTCLVKGCWWPPAIQQTFITCRFHRMLFTYCKHGLCLKCIHTITSPKLYSISICLY